MGEKDRKINFSLNVIAAFFIIMIVYCNYNIIHRQSPDAYESLFNYLSYFMVNIGAFLCTLLLQSEELLMIVRRERSLKIRWDFIILSIVCFLLGLIKFWYVLLFPRNLNIDPNFTLISATITVILVGNIDIIFMFASGIFFFQAFQKPEDINEKKKNNDISILLYILIIFLIVIIQYGNVWFFQSKFNKLTGFVYIMYFLNIFEILIISLLLQGKTIINIIKRKDTLVIQWELIVLSIIAFLLAIIKIWLILFLQNSSSVIIQSINTNSFWQIACVFASSIFFIHAFNRKNVPMDI